MTLKNNRTPLLCYFKLCAAFRSHWWIQTGVIVQKRLIWVKSTIFFSRTTLKFYGWPSKLIGHLFYATSSFVQHFAAISELKLKLQSGKPNLGQIRRFLKPRDLEIWHFIAIGEFKLELQSGNARSGSNSTIPRAVWPWNLTDGLEKQ